MCACVATHKKIMAGKLTLIIIPRNHDKRVTTTRHLSETAPVFEDAGNTSSATHLSLL